MFVKVKVFPESRENKIVKIQQDKFHIMVKEKPVNNQANEKVIEILSQYFKTEKNKIFLIKGYKESNKIFEIKD